MASHIMHTEDTINRLFERQASLTPGSTAVSGPDGSLSYGRLNETANRMAHCLLSHGAGPGTTVAVVMDHSAGMIAALLGVIKSGAAYVAMEPDFPKERIRFILWETSATIAISQTRYAGIFGDCITLVTGEAPLDEYRSSDPQAPVESSDALYILYTSGSTGKPKGVVVEHRNVANYVDAFRKEFGIGRQDRMLQCSPCTFDIFTEEVFPVLLSGGTLIIASAGERNDPGKLAALMEREKVTVISGFPYMLRDLDGYRIPPTLRLAISGGDVLRGEYVENLLQKTTVYNTYGPSETTVCATYYRLDPERDSKGAVPIGKPVSGVSVSILDKRLQPVEPGAVGEICISGKGVARGYLHREKETQTAFITGPRGERIYRSGDLGRILADGNIAFTGRMDDQVMIGGRRVESREVENVMAGYEGIGTVAVRPWTGSDGLSFLAAYYSSGDDIDRRRLVSYLSEYLPEYMIPDYFIKVDGMPKTPNGKIDRSRLPEIKKQPRQ